MGYRSDVVLIVSPKGSKDLLNEIKNSDDQTKERVMDLLSYAKPIIKQSGEKLWFWESIKWYNGEPDIDFIENVCGDKLNCDDYLFIRVGEDYTDIEQNGNYYDNSFDAYVSRTIIFNE